MKKVRLKLHEFSKVSDLALEFCGCDFIFIVFFVVVVGIVKD